MLSPSEFRDLVSGQRRGPRRPRCAACCVRPKLPYTLAVRWRNRRYDRRPGRGPACQRAGRQRRQSDARRHGQDAHGEVARAWARRARHRAWRLSAAATAQRPASRTTKPASWPRRCPTCRTCRIRDRVAAAQRAIDEFAAKLIMLDDGFQHRRLARDLDIVLLDALEPFGFDHVFPRGTLREPLAGLRGPTSSASAGPMLRRRPSEMRFAARRPACSASRVVRSGPRGQRPHQLGGQDAAARMLCRPARRRVLRHRQSGRVSPHARLHRLRDRSLARIPRSPRLHAN